MTAIELPVAERAAFPLSSPLVEHPVSRWAGEHYSTEVLDINHPSPFTPA